MKTIGPGNYPSSDKIKEIKVRFFSRIEKTRSCWIWKGYIEKDGYGSISINDIPNRSHRVSFFLHNGFLPDRKLVLDHSCRNRSCVNPDHLRPITQRKNCHENSESPCHLNALKTHCPQGHEYDIGNTRLKQGRYGIQRICRSCAREYQLRKKKGLSR